MLNIFLGRDSLPNYRLVAPPDGQLQTIIVKEDVRGILWLGK
jgi:phenylalanyl-tRNA synthetase beta chain